jgi:ubiquinone/menaquinone biosynthesis C-methylase UbiE
MKQQAPEQYPTPMAHSEHLFTPERDHWFNPDFLELMARRWGLSQYQSLLDLGCGLCHWSKLLVPHLRSGSQVTALDNDPKWAAGNADINAFFKEKKTNVRFVQGDANDLPFEDNSFDVVTCQTLLIHLKKPERALREMKRVVKPNGIVICSEPNNLIRALLQDTANYKDPIEEVLARVRQSLAHEKFKTQQHHGNDSFGDLLTGTMDALGFVGIQAYLNDKVVSIYPPYDSLEQQAKINAFLQWGQSAHQRAAFDTAYQNLLEQGGDYARFLNDFEPADPKNKVIRSLKNQTYASGGGTLLYLISGKKA